MCGCEIKALEIFLPVLCHKKDIPHVWCLMRNI